MIELELWQAAGLLAIAWAIGLCMGHSWGKADREITDELRRKVEDNPPFTRR